MSLSLMYITNQPSIARLAEQSGVDWIFVDLEQNGKVERQGHLDTVISRHTMRDVSRIRAVLKHSKLLVRVNPIFPGSRFEINEAIHRGADMIMLPYYKTAEEVRTLIELVGGRAQVCLLCETKEAVECMPEVLQIPGIACIHLGLNDLHLSYGQSFLFEPLANGLVERVVSKIQATGLPYGFGGIARIGKGILVAEQILGEHVRLKSSLVILSRSFCDIGGHESVTAQQAQLFQQEVWKIRAYEQQLQHASAEWLEKNRMRLVDHVHVIANRLEKKEILL